MQVENYLIGIDNIAKKLNINSHSRLQTFYDVALKARETLDLEIEGFTNAEMQLDSEVEFAEAKRYLRGMATYVDNESPVLARGGRVELETWKESIPTQRRKIQRGKNDYKKMLLGAQNEVTKAFLVDSRTSTKETVKNYLYNNLFDTLKVIPDSHVASKNYQIGQMLSRRALVLTADNNPGGIKDISFEARVPEENIIDQEWFTIDEKGNVTYNPSVDPIRILKQRIRGLRLDTYRGYKNVRIEMNSRTFFILLEHPVVLQRLGWGLIAPQYAYMEGKATDKAKAEAAGKEAILSNEDEFAINWFKKAVGADEIKIHTAIVGVDKLNAVTKLFDTETIDCFDEGVILIRPTGNVGIIQPVSIVRPDQSAVYADILDGWGIIEYFYEAKTRTQEWISEVSYLAMITRPRDVYYYNIQGTAASDSTEEP